MRYRLFFIAFIFSFWAQAQQIGLSPKLWHRGRVVLESKDTLRGELKYDMLNELVQLKVGGKVKTFTSQNVMYFDLIDKNTEQFRYFYSIPYNLRGNYKVPVFFEILYEGGLTLMSREFVVTESYNNYDPYYGGMSTTQTRERMDYQYFCLNHAGDIIPFSEKRNDLLDIMRDESSDVRHYVKENRLNLSIKRDLVQVTAYYNKLKEGKVKK